MSQSFQNGIHLWPAESCLVGEITREFQTTPRSQWENHYVFFPTQRLVTCFLGSLAQKAHSFKSPVVQTIETFVSSQVEELLGSKKIIIPSVGEFILADLIQKEKYQYILPGHEHEVFQLFCEICDESLEKDAFELLHKAISEDIHKSLTALSTVSKRVDELFCLYSKFHETLASKDLILPGFFFKSACKALETKFSELFHKQSKVYFVGFTTLKPYFKNMVKNFLKEDNCCFWATKKLDIFSRINPLSELISDISGNANIRYRENLQNNNFDKNITVYEESSPLRETALALKRAQEFVEKGIPPSQIAILVADEKTYSPILRALTKKSELSFNLAISLTIAETSFGIWLRQLKTLSIRLSGKAFFNFLTHPITEKCLLNSIVRGSPT